MKGGDLYKIVYAVALVFVPFALATLDKEVGRADQVGAKMESTQLPSSKEQPVSSDMADGMGSAIASTTSGFGGEMPDSLTVDNPNGTIQYNSETSEIIYEGKPCVRVKTDTKVEVEANRVIINTQQKKAFFEGDVAIFQGSGLTRATRVVYDWERKHFTTQDVTAKVDGILLKSDSLEYTTNEAGEAVIRGEQSYASTDDVAEPSAWVGAKRIALTPKEDVEFYGATASYEGVPFMWFPYFKHSLHPKEGYLPGLGMRSYWGALMTNQYGILFGNKRVEKGRPEADYVATFKLDYRSLRGVAYGLNIENFEQEKLNSQLYGLEFYGLSDDQPMRAISGEIRKPISRDRWMINLHQLWKLSGGDQDAIKWRLRANMNVMSDRYFLRDFFPDRYQDDATPDNHLALTFATRSQEVSLIQRVAPNDYYMADQRTELSHDFVRGALLNSPVIYESRSSAGILRQVVPVTERARIKTLRDDAPVGSATRKYWERMLLTDDFARVRSMHEFSSSFTAMEFLNITPKLGGGYSGYLGVQDENNISQGVGYAAVDIDIKFSRRYAGADSYALGVDGLNHVVQPYMRFSSVSANQPEALYPWIDGITPITTPQALTLGRYTQIDSINSGTITRYGMRNVFMTKRDGGSARWLSWDVFMDQYWKDPEKLNRDFSNAYSYLDWTPLPWVQYSNQVQIPFFGTDRDKNLREVNNSLTFRPTRSAEIMVGHRYLANHQLMEGSGSQLDGQLLVRINSTLALRGSWRYNTNTQKLDIQEYYIYKNMGSWYFGVNFFLRQNGPHNEYGAGISFTIKETGSHLPVMLF